MSQNENNEEIKTFYEQQIQGSHIQIYSDHFETNSSNKKSQNEEYNDNNNYIKLNYEMYDDEALYGDVPQGGYTTPKKKSNDNKKDQNKLLLDIQNFDKKLLKHVNFEDNNQQDNENNQNKTQNKEIDNDEEESKQPLANIEIFLEEYSKFLQYNSYNSEEQKKIQYQSLMKMTPLSCKKEDLEKQILSLEEKFKNCQIRLTDKIDQQAQKSDKAEGISQEKQFILVENQQKNIIQDKQI